MKRLVMIAFAAIAISATADRTATQSWVNWRVGNLLLEYPKFQASTNIADSVSRANASNVVTKAYVESLGIGGITAGIATNISDYVARRDASNVVTRAYVESLGMVGAPTATNIAEHVTSRELVPYAQKTVATNIAEYVTGREMEKIPMTYAATNSIVSANCSVQTIFNPSGSVPELLIPPMVTNGVRDWIVHVINSGDNPIPLHSPNAFRKTTPEGRPVLYYSALKLDDLTNGVAKTAITTFYFSEIGTNVESGVVKHLFSVMRSEQNSMAIQGN